MEKIIITYDIYDHMMDNLVEQIEFSKLYTKIKYVYGPPRGGLPIAVHLAHHLDLKFIILNQLGALDSHELDRVLIVDDIADTGKTLNDFKRAFKIMDASLTTATLFVKDRSIIKPDFYVEETTDWIVYPWEKINEKPNREGY